MCHQKSPFAFGATTTNMDTSVSVVTDETQTETRQLYALRAQLVYLSIYHHQHCDALEEAKTPEQHQNSANKIWKNKTLGILITSVQMESS
jgi:hypothetical protein